MKCYINRYFEVGLDYKVKDLIDYVGISRQAYNNIIKSISIPRLDVAMKICDYFCSISPDGEWNVDCFWHF